MSFVGNIGTCLSTCIVDLLDMTAITNLVDMAIMDQYTRCGREAEKD